MSVKPTKPQTPSHDNVVRVNYVCQHCHEPGSKLISVVTESYPNFERDELGLPVLDERGEPKLKMRIVPDYVAIPRVIDYEDSQQDLLEPLLQRRDNDMKLHEKAKEQLDQLRDAKKKPKAKEQELPA